ncbi:embryonic polarity protein dorsal-like [Aphidius gifuensis]|uniref:embryonic polarity protein dorsal-like n=1 Tax=Aphidius gifuensis TaxID=684658 RepID=UPI001CDD2370|nr:embryonic polarity protein dorsal-like [Aphidius gifuensis]
MDELDDYLDENVLEELLADFDANQQQQQEQQQQQQQQQQQLENLQLQQVQNFFQQQQQQQQQLFPHIVIPEQPAKTVRFRYKLECESRRSASSIPGRNSTPENKTLPTIRVIDYVGPAFVFASLVTKDSYNDKYRAHPHNLVGNKCKEGVCHFKITLTDNTDVLFPNLGIQCVKKNEIKTSLETRKELRIDPFRAGFSHANRSYALNVVRLCFEVYLPNEKDEFKFRLEPIVSEPIFDEKTLSSLRIHRVEPCCASAAGSKTVVLLCERVWENDIQVRFYGEKNNEIIWDKNAVVEDIYIHKKVTIILKTPKYDLNPDDKAVKVFVQLRRPSDGAVGEPRPFEMIQIGADDPDYLKRKRIKYDNDETLNSLRRLQNSN